MPEVTIFSSLPCEKIHSRIFRPKRIYLQGTPRRSLHKVPLLNEHLPPLSIFIVPVNIYHFFMLPESRFWQCGFLRPIIAYGLPS